MASVRDVAVVASSQQNTAHDEHEKGENLKGEDPSSSMVLKILPAAAGSFVEWYEFAIYSYLSSSFTTNFFGHLGGSLGTWFGFALSFLVRPFGGAFFGWLADTFGRKPAMQATISLMLVTTVAQGCLPTFANGEGWGWFGVVALLILRILQGLSAGGELPTAAVYITEVSPKERLGFNLSWISVSGAFGAWVVASLVVAAMEFNLSTDQMNSWGWRIPYLTSIIPGGLLVVSRRYLKETDDFEELLRTKAEAKVDEAMEQGKESQQQQKAVLTPMRELMESYKLPMAVGSFALAAVGAIWYVTPVYGPQFLKKFHKLDPAAVTFSDVPAFLIPTLMAPFMGMLIDKVGAGKVFFVGIVMGTLVAPVPLFYWWTHAPQGTAIMALYVGQCIVGVLQGLSTAIYLFTVELFPVRVRTTGTSIAYNIGIGVFGGMGPLVSDWAGQAIKPQYPVSAPAAFMLLCGVISTLALAVGYISSRRGIMRLTHIRDTPY